MPTWHNADQSQNHIAMEESYESLMSLSQVRPMIISPDLPPQLNQCVCGCRSGCGCGCPEDGDDKDDDRMSLADTAVDSIYSDDDGFTHDEQAQDHGISGHGAGLLDTGIHAPRASMPPRPVWLLTVLGRTNDSQPGEPLLGWQEVTLPPILYDGFEDATEGLYDQFLDIDSQGNAVSDRVSLHMVSPEPVIDEWVRLTPERAHTGSMHPIDIITPLRLSAEFQHARGKMVEHLLVPDVASVPELVQE